MQEFPLLNNKEVAIVKVEANTGHVLDESNNLYISDDQKAYSIFSSFNQAKKYAQQFIESHNTIEITIFDKNNRVIEVITPNK